MNDDSKKVAIALSVFFLALGGAACLYLSAGFTEKKERGSPVKDTKNYVNNEPKPMYVIGLTGGSKIISLIL